MKILLCGAGGRVGRVLLKELAARGHRLTAAYRQLDITAAAAGDATRIAVNVSSAAEIAAAAKGQDAVVSAIGPGSQKNPRIIEDAATALCEGLAAAGVARLIVVGGAGTLELRPGVMRLDDPSYPEQFRQSGNTQKAALATLKASDLDWSYVSPPIQFYSGKRTGRYRVGGDAVLYDGTGKSHISFEDYAVALADELERGANLRRRISFAY